MNKRKIPIKWTPERDLKVPDDGDGFLALKSKLDTELLERRSLMTTRARLPKDSSPDLQSNIASWFHAPKFHALQMLI
jgi:hypothetical protein